MDNSQSSTALTSKVSSSNIRLSILEEIIDHGKLDLVKCQSAGQDNDHRKQATATNVHHISDSVDHWLILVHVYLS